MTKRCYVFLLYFLPVLALSVTVLGAYVRLSDAGLGCPDWPGCYGQLVVPDDAEAIEAANRQWADRPVEIGKAWREMVHRYAASLLGFGILLLAVCAWRLSRSGRSSSLWGPLALVPLVAAQGLLGMYTVTLLLKPLVVSAHLIGGLTILALLWWNLQACRYDAKEPASIRRLAPLCVLALLVLSIQIFLGGWTSANYAALACTDFPTCQGAWWPKMNFSAGFMLSYGPGINYEYGILDTPARTAIHFSHRLWAAVTAVTLLFTAWRAVFSGSKSAARSGWCIIFALLAQVALGVSNVLFGLPLPVAVSHNAVAALLLLSVVSLLHRTSLGRLADLK